MKLLVVFERASEILLTFVKLGESMVTLVDPRRGSGFPGDLKSFEQRLQRLLQVALFHFQSSQVQEARAFRLPISCFPSNLEALQVEFPRSVELSELLINGPDVVQGAGLPDLVSLLPEDLQLPSLMLGGFLEFPLTLVNGSDSSQ